MTEAARLLAPADAEAEDLHYLAKDYSSFRRLMLDHLAVKLGRDLAEDVPSQDLAMVEALAYAADQLSYYQDAVATEAYLATARRRVSVARHARLLGYRLGEGCNARVWVQLHTAAERVRVPRGTAVATGATVEEGTPGHCHTGDHDDLFETMHAAMLTRGHNRIRLAQHRLQAGDLSAELEGVLPRLAVGMVLILRHEQEAWCHPVRLTRVEQGARSTRVSWHEGDEVPAGAPSSGPWAALGNIVLADQGRTVEQFVPDGAVPGGNVSIQGAQLAYAAPYRHEQAIRCSAAAALVQRPDEAEPAVELHETLDPPLGRHARTRLPWLGARDLIHAGPEDRRFAVEHEHGGRIRLRFGDGVNGRRPGSDWRYRLRYRIGGGARGNVGPGTVVRMANPNERIIAVRNPMAAAGGADPETIEHARAAAVVGSGEGCRCVTEADYAAAALRVPGVGAAFARRGRDGEMDGVTIFVARQDGRPVRHGFVERVQAHLAPLRLIGDELEVRGASYVAPDIEMELHIPDTHLRRRVADAVRASLARDIRLGLGERLVPARLIETAQSVPGVAQARLIRFGGTTEPAQHEIVRIDPDRVTLVHRADG
ncbi:MAG TPA: baseplate J/gp47 family protein [Allosphingosinicella sp.]